MNKLIVLIKLMERVWVRKMGGGFFVGVCCFLSGGFDEDVSYFWVIVFLFWDGYGDI